MVFLYILISLLSLGANAEVNNDNNDVNRSNKTLHLMFPISFTGGLTLGQSVASALLLGIREVKNRGILPGYDIDFVFRDTACSPRRGKDSDLITGKRRYARHTK